MKQYSCYILKVLAVSCVLLASTVWADAKSTINSQSTGDITATADASGSNNKVRASASVISIRTKNNHKVNISTKHHGDVAAIAGSNGSNNDIEARATIVDITSD